MHGVQNKKTPALARAFSCSVNDYLKDPGQATQLKMIAYGGNTRYTHTSSI